MAMTATSRTVTRRAARRLAALIPGSTPGTTYLVTAGGCSCPDFVFRRAAAGKRCKHMEQTKRGTATMPAVSVPCGGQIRPGSVVTLTDAPKFRRVPAGLVVADVTVSAFTGEIAVTVTTSKGRGTRTVGLGDIAQVIEP